MTFPLTLEAVVANARKRYLAFLQSRIEKARQAPEHFAVELLVKPNGWPSPPPFCFSRVDLIFARMDGPRIERVIDDVELGLPETDFQLENGLLVTAGTLGWEEFVVTFSRSTFDLSALSPWLERWLDTAEIRAEDEHGLSGVVHSVAWSNDEPDRWQVTMDFGSAPLEAFREFLAFLATSGVRTCRVLPPSL